VRNVPVTTVSFLVETGLECMAHPNRTMADAQHNGRAGLRAPLWGQHSAGRRRLIAQVRAADRIAVPCIDACRAARRCAWPGQSVAWAKPCSIDDLRACVARCMHPFLTVDNHWRSVGLTEHRAALGRFARSAH